MKARRPQRWTFLVGTWAEGLLWTVAAVCLGYFVFAGLTHTKASVEAGRIQEFPDSTARDSQARSGGRAAPELTGTPKVSEGQVLGQLEIVALGLRVPIVSGIENSSLLKGVGHVKGTAFPGGLGTVGLAGHRDTYLRSLERVAVGMDIRVAVRTGTYHYRVDRWEVVAPERVDVLEIRSEPELVLITCYPFRFVGAAPNRFVVHAHLVSAASDVR